MEIVSYGKYTKWDRSSKKLPELMELTSTVPAEKQIAQQEHEDFMNDGAESQNWNGRSFCPTPVEGLVIALAG